MNFLMPYYTPISQDKNYTLPFAVDDRQIIRLGISFDSRTRNIDKVIVG